MTASRTILLTALALVAFAGNSVLARLAIIDGAIGPAAFTGVRILSGAAVLCLLVGLRDARGGGSWSGALSLLGYAALFSLAYLELSTGTGALILFASVQITMIGWGMRAGERLGSLQVLGVVLALGGLIWLLLPGLSQPDPLAAALMIGSGLCWGVYSLLGRGTGAPSVVTAGNFLRASLLAVPLFGLWLWLGEDGPVSGYGIALAIVSGAVTSGLGYAVWYAALKGLSASRAGVVQLAVPPLAALGGIALLGEDLSLRFVLASAITLLGIALAIRPYANSK